jgi:hypothetical protein
MNRRAFNALISSGVTGIALGERGLAAPAELRQQTTDGAGVGWPEGVHRRLLVDMHVPDWDPRLLGRFDAVDYVSTIAAAGFQSVMQYAKSQVGLCLWRSKIGPVHANMRGRDYFGEVMEACRRRKLRTVAFYTLIYDNWAFDHYPDWRIIPEDGCDRILGGRRGVVCPNSPYRDRVLSELRELVGHYDFDGIFLDMAFWPDVCYCAHCTERLRKEHSVEPPRIINWDDPTWRMFQKAREKWLLEFATLVTKTIKEVRPITVNHQYSTIFADWKAGAPLEIRNACDYVGGDFYGGPTQFSLVCKAYYGLTRERPFEFHTSRTIGLNDFETTKPFNELLVSSYVATLHSAASLIIDSINPDGTLNHAVYDYLEKENAKRSPYEPFLGGDMLTDVAIYYDKESMYNPAHNGMHVARANEGWLQTAHITAVVGAARILREAHIPYGVITNVTLDQLANFRAVMVPNVLEMTAEQAARFRTFVEMGGVLYASGPSSLDRFNSSGPAFLLEDVLGVRYKEMLGTTWTYLSPHGSDLKTSIWPQDAVSFPGPMIHTEALPEAVVLATVTLPFVNPNIGNCINDRFAQIHNNPPALTEGTAPGIVVHSFGRGKAIWLAAPIESAGYMANFNIVSSLLRRALPRPYHFEVDTQESVEMTLFHQSARRRLLVSLLNMEWQLPFVSGGATVRICMPSGRRATTVLGLPKRKSVPFRKTGAYVEFDVEPFEMLTMLFVEYE